MKSRKIRVMQITGSILEYVFGVHPYNAATLTMVSGVNTLTVNSTITQPALAALKEAVAETVGTAAVNVVYADLHTI